MRKKKLGNKKVYIDNNLTKKERRIQRELVEVAKTKRERGAIVKIGYQKLKVNEGIFKWKDEGEMKEVKFWRRQGPGDPHI